MKRIAKIAQFTSGFVLLASVGSAPADNHKVLILEVAADCRTFVNGPNRADVSFGSGKLFPTGTLPSGTASNDPTEPVTRNRADRRLDHTRPECFSVHT